MRGVLCVTQERTQPARTTSAQKKATRPTIANTMHSAPATRRPQSRGRRVRMRGGTGAACVWVVLMKSGAGGGLAFLYGLEGPEAPSQWRFGRISAHSEGNGGGGRPAGARR